VEDRSDPARPASTAEPSNVSSHVARAPLFYKLVRKNPARRTTGFLLARARARESVYPFRPAFLWPDTIFDGRVFLVSRSRLSRSPIIVSLIRERGMNEPRAAEYHRVVQLHRYYRRFVFRDILVADCTRGKASTRSNAVSRVQHYRPTCLGTCRPPFRPGSNRTDRTGPRSRAAPTVPMERNRSSERALA